MFRPLLMSLFVGVAGTADAQDIAADIIVENGTIYTANQNQETVEAIAITDGEIVYVGDL